jgi:hypothetical protein
MKEMEDAYENELKNFEMINKIQVNKYSKKIKVKLVSSYIN